MGCGLSTQDDGGGGPRRKQGSVGDVVVFLPGLRTPRSVDFSSQALDGRLDKSAVERLSALRARVVDMAMQESAAALKPKRKTSARHGMCRASEPILAWIFFFLRVNSCLDSCMDLRTDTWVVIYFCCCVYRIYSC